MAPTLAYWAIRGVSNVWSVYYRKNLAKFRFRTRVQTHAAQNAQTVKLYWLPYRLAELKLCGGKVDIS